MKRSVALILCLLAASPRLWVAADPLSDASALALQRDAEERSKRLSAEIQTIQETQELLVKNQAEFRQRLERLADEVRNLKEDQNRSSGNMVSRDELRKYVREIDEKREADKKVILENIRDLAKVPVAPPPAPKTTSARPAPEPVNEEPPFVYTVRKSDRLLDIVAEYNDYFQKHGQPKITVDQVLKANPGLKADRLVAGKKIRIPVLGKEKSKGE